MEEDARLLASALAEPGAGARWRVYRWGGAVVSLGRSTAEPADACDVLAARGIRMERRPTGGGVLVHGGDVSFAVAVPDGTMAVPRSIVGAGRLLARPVLDALRALGFAAQFRRGEEGERGAALCFLQRSGVDIMIGGRKVAAFAARRVRGGWFQHGSVLVEPVPNAVRQGLCGAGIGTAADWGRVDEAVAPLSALGPATLGEVGEAIGRAAGRLLGAPK